jgi:hypothetical protein
MTVLSTTVIAEIAEIAAARDLSRVQPRIKYPFVWAQAALMGSFTYYPRERTFDADRDGAPWDAAFARHAGGWHRWSEEGSSADWRAHMLEIAVRHGWVVLTDDLLR